MSPSGPGIFTVGVFIIANLINIQTIYYCLNEHCPFHQSFNFSDKILIKVFSLIVLIFMTFILMSPLSFDIDLSLSLTLIIVTSLIYFLISMASSSSVLLFFSQTQCMYLKKFFLYYFSVLLISTPLFNLDLMYFPTPTSNFLRKKLTVAI